MLTAGEIAELVGGCLEGDSALKIASANTLSDAGPADLAFAEPGAAGVADSRAGCILIADIAEDGATKTNCTTISVSNPRNAFAAVLARMYPPEEVAPGVDPTASVAESAEIAPSATIGPYCTVGPKVRVGARTVLHAGVAVAAESTIGEGCVLHSGVVLYSRGAIADRTILHSGSVIGADGFGFVFEQGRYQKFPQVGGVRIGSDVEIGSNTTIDRGTLGDTVIGDGVKLDNLIHIGHNCRLGNHVVIAAQTGLSGGVVVEDYVVMGGQVGIGEKASIGAQAQIGGQGGILPHRRVVGGKAYWGTPARPHREYLRSQAAVERIPKLKAEIAKLRRRLEELESK